MNGLKAKQLTFVLISLEQLQPGDKMKIYKNSTSLHFITLLFSDGKNAWYSLKIADSE